MVNPELDNYVRPRDEIEGERIGLSRDMAAWAARRWLGIEEPGQVIEVRPCCLEAKRGAYAKALMDTGPKPTDDAMRERFRGLYHARALLEYPDPA